MLVGPAKAWVGFEGEVFFCSRFKNENSNGGSEESCVVCIGS